MKTVYVPFTSKGKWLREHSRKTTCLQATARVNTLAANTVNPENELSSIPPAIMNATW